MANKIYGVWVTGGALSDRWLTIGNGMIFHTEFDNAAEAQLTLWKNRLLSQFEQGFGGGSMTANVKEIGFDGEPKPRVP